MSRTPATQHSPYRKFLYAAAFSAVLTGGVAPAFAASADVSTGSAVASRSRDVQSSYSLHSALLRAPAAPAASSRR